MTEQAIAAGGTELKTLEGKELTVRCPHCNAERGRLSEVFRKDFNMTFIRCEACKSFIAYRDNALLEKLDAILKAVEVKA